MWLVQALRQKMPSMKRSLKSLYIIRCPYVRISVTLVNGANDVIMRIAGLVTDGTVRRYGDWQHVAMGCNSL